MKIQMPKQVLYILKIINENGYEAFIVGGCVRDSLLGKLPEDWDITTNAKPEMIIKIFKNKGYSVIPTGLKHGTVTLLIDGEHYEITTYRVDGEYKDSRRPSSVEFALNIKEDLSRRDFTINSMAYNDFHGLVDYFDGYKDLTKKSINAVGDPNKRFKEDALRMMRGIRFSAQLGFKLETETKIAILDNVHLLEKISKERIRDEFSKIIVTQNPSKYILEMLSMNLMKYIIPELYECVEFKQHNPHHDKDVLNHILSVVDNTEGDLILRLSALFHDIGKPHSFTIDEKGIGHFYSHHLVSTSIAKKAMKRLRYDKKTIDVVSTLVKEHMSKFEVFSTKGIKRFINRVGVENLDRLFKLQMADTSGSANKDNSKVLELKDEVEKVLSQKQPLLKKDMEISGYDLIQLGIPEGKEIGRILNELLEEVLENPELNTKEKLIAIVKEKSR